jgi:hypothetical protein
MTGQTDFEFPIQRACREMQSQGMEVSHAVSFEGAMVHFVDGFALTTSQILDLAALGQLTASGIRTFAAQFEQELNEQCGFLSYCPECRTSKPVSSNRGALVRSLRNGSEISVVSICGHSWKLQDNERVNLRSALDSRLV